MNKILKLGDTQLIEFSAKSHILPRFDTIIPRASLHSESKLNESWKWICRYSMEPVLLLDENQQILRANQQFCEFTGYSLEEVEGLGLNQCCALPDNLFQKLLQTSPNRLRQYAVVPFFTQTSKVVYGKISVQPAPEAEQSYRFQLTISDVSDFVETNKKLRKRIGKNHQIKVGESMIATGLKSKLHNLQLQLKDIIANVKSKPLNQALHGIADSIAAELEQIEESQTFLQHFENISLTFIYQLSLQYPDLTAAEIKHCAYVLIQLSPYEVSRILGVNRKSVEMARYRVKRKLGLEKEQSLRLFLTELATDNNHSAWLQPI